jgi:glycosyltransferase involved in cell wall biosynthesis
LGEGTPTSALEAMTCGLPVISSNAGGLNNIIKDHINGFIISSFSINQFIDKLRLVKSDPGLRKNMFINNVELAKKYKWEFVAKNITDKTIRCFDGKK